MSTHPAEPDFNPGLKKLEAQAGLHRHVTPGLGPIRETKSVRCSDGSQSRRLQRPLGLATLSWRRDVLIGRKVRFFHILSIPIHLVRFDSRT